MTLRAGTTHERPLQASKWISSQVLIDGDEMKDLFQALGDPYLFICGVVNPSQGSRLPLEIFLNHYKEYVDKLKAGVLPDPRDYQKWFCPAMTSTLDALFAVPVGEKEEIVKISSPIIQMRAHTMDYSPIDKKFHSMVFGSDNIPWGIQFAYPQLALDAATGEVLQVRNAPEFSNSQLFKTLQSWVRSHTIPTPFLIDGVVKNEPVRIGKNCLSWINNHPQLLKKGVSVPALR
jgi:hypothetical protein